MSKETKAQSKFYVLYVDGCVSKTKAFSTLDLAEEFISDFKEEFDGNNDNWIEDIYYGVKLTVKTKHVLVASDKK